MTTYTVQTTHEEFGPFCNSMAAGMVYAGERKRLFPGETVQLIAHDEDEERVEMEYRAQ